MRIKLFYHSLISDWNHGNAHFLRGVVTELQLRGHQVTVFEPVESWSLQNLLAEHGSSPIADFAAAYPHLQSQFYWLDTLNLDRELDDADLVIVHEWNDQELVWRVADHRKRRGRYRLLFHDTHHRALTDREGIAAYQLADYDGVLAFGRVLRDHYLRQRWARRAWIWHEAADTRVFHPRPHTERAGDLVWVGNWGDEERSAQLHEFLFEPVQRLGLQAEIYGVRYPQEALHTLQAAGVTYKGWLPNYRAPEVFARFRVTVHIPRQPYVKLLPGIPTIRIFEALACGIPLVCSPWHDVEGLFTPGKDYLVAHNGDEMAAHLRLLLDEPAVAQELAAHGLRTLRARHTCAHRVDELLAICKELGVDTTAERVRLPRRAVRPV
ncbi:MAG: glycosyltransferase [Chloroflexi bacterium]|nr:MAG: glycosyltransferase [Chloroflexota bacterium]